MGQILVRTAVCNADGSKAEAWGTRIAMSYQQQAERQLNTQAHTAGWEEDPHGIL